jgi:hypothetical protein
MRFEADVETAQKYRQIVRGGVFFAAVLAAAIVLDFVSALRATRCWRAERPTTPFSSQSITSGINGCHSDLAFTS